MSMELTIQEFENLGSIKMRYVNITKRFIPDIANFDTFARLIRELHLIHQTECKIVMQRVLAVNEHKEVTDQSHCHPGRFFKFRSVLGEFNRFWREFNDGIYTKEFKANLAAAYAQEPRITCIEVGYHINLTGKERGRDLLAILNAGTSGTRVTFADGTVLTIPTQEAADLAQARVAYEKKMRPQMIPVR